MPRGSSIVRVAAGVAVVVLCGCVPRGRREPPPAVRLSLPAPPPGPCGSRERVPESAGGAYVGCGPLPAFVISDAVRERAAEFEACRGGPVAAKERFVVTWTVGPEGAVVAARATVVPTGGADVADCLVREVRRLAFPSPLGGAAVNVSFPFIFEPSRGARARCP